MKILLAHLVSTWAHRGQKRKVTEETYIRHPRRVAREARRLGWGRDLQSAALLHDVLEDSEFPRWLLRLLFGSRIYWLVVDLTDVYTPERFPNHNRAWRKEREHRRLARASRSARMLKLLDLKDNLDDIATREAIEQLGDFVRIVGEEAEDLISKMPPTAPTLQAEIYSAAKYAQMLAEFRR